MTDASTDDLHLTADAGPTEVPDASPGEVPGAAPHAALGAGRDADPRDDRPEPEGDDDPVEAPVVGCIRCEATVVMGSRYCPSCGAPLVRTGLQAASGLSRTRRRAPRVAQVGVPVLLVGVIAAIGVVATHDPQAAARTDVQSRLGRVVDAHRALSARLVTLRAADEPAAVLRAARAAQATADEVAEELTGSGVVSGETGRTTRATAATKASATYLDAVVTVLRDPDSPRLASLGRRSKQAIEALEATDDIVEPKDAIRGTAVLARYVRGRA